MASTISAGTTSGTAIVVSGDTTGNLAFQTNGTTTAMTINTSQNVQLNAAAGKILNSSGNPILQQTGSVLQVAQATFTGTQTITTGGVNANWTDITSMSVTITPTSSSSKFLLFAQINVGCITVDRIAYLRFQGGNSGNFVGDTAGSRARVAAFNVSPSGIDYGIVIPVTLNYLDSPATASAITYKVQAAPNFSTGNIAINYNPGSDADQAYIPRSACSLIVMEIAG
jgi:hypothetical protein